MAKGDTVIGWKVGKEDRRALLKHCPPKYSNVVADHVTLRADATAETPLPRAVHAAVVGRADDGQGVECLVVALDGSTDRPDGSTYHITWSLKSGRTAIESNDVLRDDGWKHFDMPIPITLIPARL